MFVIRSGPALAGACAVAALVLTGAAPATAAPYTDDPVVQTSNTNPAVGGQLPLNASGFDPNEPVFVELHSQPVLLQTLNASSTGEVTTVVQLPPGYVCQHTIVIRDAASEDVASTAIIIGPPEACSGNGNVGNGNSGSGNVGNGNHGDNNRGNGNPGSGNVGNGNSGSGNVGNGNTGSGNVGNGNTGGGDYIRNPNIPNGNTDWSTMNYARTSPAPDRHSPAVALVSVAGLAAVAGGGFLHRRRQRT